MRIFTKPPPPLPSAPHSDKHQVHAAENGNPSTICVAVLEKNPIDARDKHNNSENHKNPVVIFLPESCNSCEIQFLILEVVLHGKAVMNLYRQQAVTPRLQYFISGTAQHFERDSLPAVCDKSRKACSASPVKAHRNHRSFEHADSNDSWKEARLEAIRHAMDESQKIRGLHSEVN